MKVRIVDCGMPVYADRIKAIKIASKQVEDSRNGKPMVMHSQVVVSGLEEGGRVNAMCMFEHPI